jgi:D-alanine-D-alanine ligase
MKKIKVCLIFGGKNGEHEVSLQSAESIYNAFDKNKYEILLVRVDKKGKWLLQKKPSFNKEIYSGDFEEINPFSINSRVDVFFPIIHGTFGEDGSIQGLFELLDKPYVGAFVLGSAVGMDKDIMNRLLRDARILIPKFYAIKKLEITPELLDDIINDLKFPIFVKPASMGSSVGVSKATDKASLSEHISTAFSYDTKILLEESIKGQEIECSVLGNDNPIASICGEIVPRYDFYSYEAKYIDEEGAIIKIPAGINKATQLKIQETAKKIFKVLECSGMARVDFFLTKDKIYANEINTLPGFTKISMYPKLWEASGIPFTQLLEKLITLAFEKKKEKDLLKRDYV